MTLKLPLASLLAALVSLSALSAAPALAQDDSVAAARQLRRDGQLEEALAMLTRVQAEEPSALVRGQIGLTLAQLERWVEAHENLAAAEAMGGPWVEANRDRISVALAAIRQHVGRLDVTGAPAGATLLVDGVERGTLPLERPFALESGEVVLEVSATGYVPYHAVFMVNEGNLSVVALTLSPTGGTATETPTPDASGGGVDPAPWILVGVGAAVAVTGAVLIGVGQSEVAAVNDPPPGTVWSEFEGRADTALALSNAGVAMLPIGLVIAGVGLVWALVSGDGSSEDAAARLGPVRF